MTQVSFRLDDNVYEQFNEKIKLSGKTKQHFFVSAIEDFLKAGGDGEVSQGSGLGSIDTKDIDEVVKGYLPDIASLVALNPEFLALVADKVKDSSQDEVKGTLESKVNEVKESTTKVFNDMYFGSGNNDPVIDYDRESMEKLKKLPSRLSQTQVETALGIPLTYLSKYKDNPEKLLRWAYFLGKMTKLDNGGYFNLFSEID